MGRKIFVTYKYADTLVESLSTVWFQETKARNYVDEIEKIISEEDHIYKGESDNESLAEFKDTTIASKLRAKIFDSTMTLILVSKGMKDSYQYERNQWMPLEIAYSFKVMSKGGRTSGTNGALAVILPDENGSYEYYIGSSQECNCRVLKTDFLFKIMKANMFNIKSPTTSECNGSTIYSGYSSYIHSVKWSDFKENPNKYFQIESSIKDRLDEYEITKTIE
jgi:hypothetical protein